MTKLPRLNVSMTEEQHVLLKKLGALQGRSAASFLREMLDNVTPMLEGMLPVYEAAAEMKAVQPEALQAAIRSALGELEANAAQLNLLDLVSRTTARPGNDVGAEDAPAAGEDAAPAPSRKRRRK